MASRGPLGLTIVTGANGFVAQHLIAALAARGGSVIGVGRQDGAFPGIAPNLERYLCCDMTDVDEVRKLPLDEASAVVNLAGLAAVGASFAEPDLYLRVNRGSVAALCEVAAERDLAGLRIVAVSSGAVYAGNSGLPICEDAEVSPASSPYAASKIAMEECARDYRGSGIDCVVARPFNHLGPGQGPGFLVPDLLSQIKALGPSGGVLEVGDLTTRRDYTDVRDVVGAYIELACAPTLRHSVYNVCSGRSIAGTEIFAMLLAAMGDPPVRTRVAPTRFRPSEQRDVQGDNSRIVQDLGWRPAIPIESSIADVVQTCS